MTMTVGEAIGLGVLQGATEFLPVSSSGHLAAVRGLLGLRAPGGLTFDVLLHLASLAAVLIVFRREILHAVMKERRILVAVVVASLPLAGALLLKDIAEVLAEQPGFAGAALMFTGCVLYAGTKLPAGRRDCAELRPAQALKVGFAQLAAVFPGISRSGMTIVMGQAAGLTPEASIAFAFLIFIPAVSAAGLLHSVEMLRLGGGAEFAPLAAGAAAALVSSVAALSVLKSVIRRWGLGIFAIYCLVAGAGVIVLSFWYNAG
jgi:undecaprenyl-diphosphatase